MKDYERLYIHLNRCLRVQGYSKHELISWMDDGEVLFQTIEQALAYIEKKYYKDYKPVKRDRPQNVMSIREYIQSKDQH